MRVPEFLIRPLFPFFVEWVAQKRARTLSEAENRMEGELRSAGRGVELDIALVASALAKVRKVSAFDAEAAVRAGFMLGLSDRTLPVDPSRGDLARAALGAWNRFFGAAPRK